ncbi:MAG: hypothetical protein ACFFHV_10945 [Promethearchaeota archaeon]
MIRNVHKIMFSVFMFSILFSTIALYNTQTVVATSGDDKKINIDDGDEIQKQIRANERVRFRFRERTEITVECNEKANCSIDCDAKKIGDKDFEIEIESDDPINLTMNCKEEQNSLGLLKGNTYTARDRNRYTYREGFVVKVESSEDDIQAKLRIKENDENRGGTWAYYDKKNEEWVPVETTSKNGYLECETDHFSTWTILVPEIDYTLLLIIGAGIGAIVLLGLTILLIKRRK